MSQFYDQASLVMVPSGYKAGKVYSQKPLSTDGELTFTRNSNATRVNADGLVEKVRTNVLLQSNSFDTTWTNTNTTETGGQADKDGGATSWKIDKTAASGYISQTTSLSGLSTFSVYLKAGTSTWVRLIAFVGGFATDGSAYINLSDGTVGVTSNLISTKIESIGGGWYRCSVTPLNSPISEVRIYPAEANSTAASSGNIYIQDAQLETGDIATDYIPTTSAAVSVGPTANVPRLDYTPTLGQSGGEGCPSLLLEPQRTNVLTYSEQLDNAVWSKYITTITQNSIVSPSGYQDADLATSTAGGDLKNILTLATNTTYTASFYVKKGTASDAKYRVYNFDAGVNVVAATSYISQTNTSNWTRVSFTFTTGASGTSHGIYLLQNASAGTMYFWGAQVEAGSYATSYIPTGGSGASVTRLADAGNVNVSSLLTSTATYTWFVEFIVPQSGPGGGEITFKDTGGSSQLRIYCNQANTVGMRVDDGSQNFYINVSIGDTAKCLFQCTNGLVKGFYNGELVKTFIVDTGMNAQVIHLGPPVSAPNVKQMLLFNSALSDADCETLTAL